MPCPLRPASKQEAGDIIAWGNESAAVREGVAEAFTEEDVEWRAPDEFEPVRTPCMVLHLRCILLRVGQTRTLLKALNNQEIVE